MNDPLRERALRLLAPRDYARLELAARLAPHAAGSAAPLDALLDALAASGLLSDERYAGARVNLRGARVGDVRLAYDLRSKGVAADLVRAALAAGEDELTRARRVWQRKFGRQRTVADDATKRIRQMRFLAGRGFSSDTIRRVLRRNLEDD